MQTVRQNLNRLYRKYSYPEYILTDPLEFPRRYRRIVDIETAALISSLFAYGNVTAMKKFLENVFLRMGEFPADSVLSGEINVRNLYYRFQTEKDIASLFSAMREVYDRFRISGSLDMDSVLPDSVFSAQNGNDKNKKIEISQLTYTGPFNLNKELNFMERIDGIRSAFLDAVPLQRRTQGYRHLIGAGSIHSARKRYCMFYRWMTRNGFPDFHIYRNISPSELVIPLDTHIMKVSGVLGLRTRKSQDWKTALEITENLKKVNPGDPLRYDFSLTRPGIIGDIFPVSI